MINFDFETYTKSLINKEDIINLKQQLPNVTEILNVNNDLMEWYNLDDLFKNDLITKIKNTATYIKNNCDVFLVMGIGGSFIGAKAIIEALSPYFYNNTNYPKIYFAGNTLSSNYYHDLIENIKDKDIIINVISKSGDTLESLVGYNLLMKLMKDKYNEEELRKRIIITTNKDNGFLREEVKKNNFQSFVIPDNLTGRYSVFSPVGLLPVAVANIDINGLYKGAKEANNNIDNQLTYAIIRYLMYKQGKYVESYVIYEPKLYIFLEWLKQLYAESLGKEEKGILPISFLNTRDLHSLGQFIQQGNKILFETVINIKNNNYDFNINQYNKTINDLNLIAQEATSQAHYEAKILNNIITVNNLNAYTLGYLFQFFMISCVISGYIEKVNPFNQEGVNNYKENINKLISKKEEINI